MLSNTRMTGDSNVKAASGVRGTIGVFAPAIATRATTGIGGGQHIAAIFERI